jgi:hypothetical protein
MQKWSNKGLEDAVTVLDSHENLRQVTIHRVGRFGFESTLHPL